jgi:hypothetical protein
VVSQRLKYFFKKKHMELFLYSMIMRVSLIDQQRTKREKTKRKFERGISFLCSPLAFCGQK